MNIAFALLLMIFLHIVDDYYLQGWLASAKQKKWWKENAPQELYKHDYIIALLMHAFSWTFMVMLPLAILKEFVIDSKFISVFIIDLVCHANIDNLKANKLKINLIQDQVIHLIQIYITWFILIM